MIQTTSLETSKLLKENGFKQDSDLCYPNSFNRVVRFQIANHFGQDFVSAPTTDELLAELPDQLNFKKGIKGVMVFITEQPYDAPPVFNESLPEALAQMWLWLKKEGLI